MKPCICIFVLSLSLSRHADAHLKDDCISSVHSREQEDPLNSPSFTRSSSKRSSGFRSRKTLARTDVHPSSESVPNPPLRSHSNQKYTLRYRSSNVFSNLRYRISPWAPASCNFMSPYEVAMKLFSDLMKVVMQLVASGQCALTGLSLTRHYQTSLPSAASKLHHHRIAASPYPLN